MPLKPIDHSIINGKKFMPLGGGNSPIKLASLQQEFISIKRQPFKPLPRKITGMKSPEPVEPTAKESKPITAAKEPAPAKPKAKHLWPIASDATSTLSSAFGERTHPITGQPSFHEGIDIAAAHGSDVIATHDGTISDIGTHHNLGRYVKLTHQDGSYALYGHLSKIKATPGQTVTAGEKIGEVGSTGRSTGPHLDYSLRVNGKAINPLPLLAKPKKQQLAAR